MRAQTYQPSANQAYKSSAGKLENALTAMPEPSVNDAQAGPDLLERNPAPSDHVFPRAGLRQKPDSLPHPMDTERIRRTDHAGR